MRVKTFTKMSSKLKLLWKHFELESLKKFKKYKLFQKFKYSIFFQENGNSFFLDPL